MKPRRPGCPGYDGSFLERLPVRCLTEGCEGEATVYRTLPDGWFPPSVNVCADCDAELELVGLFDPLVGATVEERHWMDDPGPPAVRYPPPWRTVAWGLAGKDRPTLARIVAREELERQNAVRDELEDPDWGPSSSNADAASWEALRGPVRGESDAATPGPPDALALF